MLHCRHVLSHAISCRHVWLHASLKESSIRTVICHKWLYSFWLPASSILYPAVLALLPHLTRVLILVVALENFFPVFYLSVFHVEHWQQICKGWWGNEFICCALRFRSYQVFCKWGITTARLGEYDFTLSCVVWWALCCVMCVLCVVFLSGMSVHID